MPVPYCIITQSVKMHGAIIILYFLGFVTGKIGENATHQLQSKIIGGQPVDIRYRPFMLSLHNSHSYLCGASILSKTWGITALHCFPTLSFKISVWSSRYYVRAGSNKTNKGGSVHKVTNIHVYNDTYLSWFSSIPEHDVALFEVRPPFRFSRTIRPTHLPKPTDELQRQLFVCGWGYTNIGQDKRSAETLMGVQVQHVPFEACVKTVPEYEILVKNDNHLCYGTQGKDSCYGDSGGALANKKTIYGIVSFGHHCGQVPGVYAKVSYYLNWIKNVTNL